MNVKCQSCGASQNINEGENCSFCGSLIIDDEKINDRIDKLNSNGNLFKLAEVAFEGGDFDEAINYYNRCLEIDSEFFEAWYKKGLSILNTSTIGNFKSKQIISVFKQSINNSPNAENFKKRLKKDVIPFVSNYYIISYTHFQEFKTLSNSIPEFTEKLNRANDTVEFIIEEVGLDIDEIKKIHGILSEIEGKMGMMMIGKILDSSGFNGLEHATKKIKSMKDEKLLPLWQKLEPDSAPKKTGCFIATAAMGNYDHPVVVDLRIFRDDWLLKRNWGVQFTNWYYTHGPKAASVIEKSSFLKVVTFISVVKPLQFITKLFR